jgi:putative addiction module component (TIGR02574 family)
MTAHTLDVFKAAEKLPPMEKIELIEHLFFSLDSKGERDRIDQLWAAEAEDRLSAYERGEMKSVPAAEVFNKLEAPRSR